jgi:hypothetical protein
MVADSRLPLGPARVVLGDAEIAPCLIRFVPAEPAYSNLVRKPNLKLEGLSDALQLRAWGEADLIICIGPGTALSCGQFT